MRSFVYKMNRIVRHYKKANQDPTIVADWLIVNHILFNEPKTLIYYHDMQQLRDRKFDRDEDWSERLGAIFS